MRSKEFSLKDVGLLPTADAKRVARDQQKRRGMMNICFSRASLLCATALVSVTGSAALAQDASATGQKAAASHGESYTNDIVVTGSRRETTLMKAPINISAVAQETLEAQRVDDIQSLGSFVPGVTISDTGPNSTGRIILRGISTADSSATGAYANNSIGVYLGETPLYIDFKLIDIDRVEVLQGPQGTLYGLGTLAGAVRYIPKRPNTDGMTVEMHGRGYRMSHSSDFGGSGDVAINVPIIEDHVAFRTATGYYNEAGFIDYNYLQLEPGVTDPQPVRATATSTGSFGTAADYPVNFKSKADVNYERTFTTRNQLLLEYNPNVKMYLTYAYQQTKTGGRQANGAGVLGTGRYELPKRYLEPSNRKSDLYAAELNINLFNIAQLVSTTAYTKQSQPNTEDYTDLLLNLDFGYENFPDFSAYGFFTRDDKQFNQEVRLVSSHGGPFNWTIGGFYNKQKSHGTLTEYTPGFAQYFGIPRPDNLEYLAETFTTNTEKAAYGELTFHVTDKWQVTGGLRYFKYNASVRGGAAVPFFNQGIDPYPAVTILPSAYQSGTASDNGIVWKANTSYEINDNLLGYLTYSTGYRIGGVNQVAPCSPEQIVQAEAGAQITCALPNEVSYGPDKTRNIEIGLRGSVFDRRLQFVLDAYHVKWSGVQVPAQTKYNEVRITGNAGGAVAKGFDIQAIVKAVPNLTVIGTYSYVDAHLTQDAAGLVVSQKIAYDAFAGDRLPGSQKHAGSVQLIYNYPLGDGKKIQANWASVYHGNILTRTGNRGNGETLPHYITHSASLTYVTDQFEVGLFADNIFDKYAVTAITNDLGSYNLVRGDVVERHYQRGVLTPRRVGMEFRIRY